MERKFKNGERVKVKYGHIISSNHKNESLGLFVGEKNGWFLYDASPEITNDTATVQYTYAEKYGGGDNKSYGLKFDKYGLMSWFDESNLISVYG